MRSRRQFLLGFLCLLPVLRLGVDTPRPPPQLHTVISRNFEFEADRDPRANETIVYNRNLHPEGYRTRGEVVWKFPRWFRAFLLSSDGSAIVAQTDYLNAVPAKVATDDYVLLTFIRNGKVIREITVSQLLDSHPKMRLTAGGNFVWGRVYEPMAPNDLVLVDADSGFFIFEAKTGKCVFPENNPIDPTTAHYSR
jgi:hypothetical protein